MTFATECCSQTSGCVQVFMCSSYRDVCIAVSILKRSSLNLTALIYKVCVKLLMLPVGQGCTGSDCMLMLTFHVNVRGIFTSSGCC